MPADPKPLAAAFLDFASLGPADLDLAGLQGTLPGIHLYDHTASPERAVRVAGCEVLLVNKVDIDAALLAGAPRLRYIGLAATGIDNVEVSAARDLGIAVTNIRNYCAPSVVQHVFGLVLALTLRLREYDALLAADAWQRSRDFCLLDFPSRELAGKTFGIVGLGNLGLAVAGVAQAFGMRVLAAAREPGPVAAPGGIERVPWPDLLGQVDVLSLHCPLTPATRHLLNAGALARMRPGSLLINTARGALVDPTALLAALQGGHLGGAGIDVLDVEPPVNGHPLLQVRLPNLIVTPHIAWAARESRQRALDEVVANVTAWQAGERRNRVD
jgi:glycerate dehydrogenase